VKINYLYVLSYPRIQIFKKDLENDLNKFHIIEERLEVLIQISGKWRYTFLKLYGKAGLN
jgi:hypothetical protein